MRFKRPKNGHYIKYCFGCRHYEFDRQVGCAYLGKCTAIEDEPTEQDAYDPPCGLWEKRADTPQTESTGSPIGDYRDGVGAWHTDCEDRYAVRTDSGEVVAHACPLGCEQTDCPWK